MSNPLPSSVTRPLLLAACWALPALAAATALTTGGHSVLRALVLVALLVTATLAAALMPALAARRTLNPGPLSPAEAAAGALAAMCAFNLALSTTSSWAGGAATPHWFLCVIILALASALIVLRQGNDEEDPDDLTAPPRTYPDSLG